LVRGGGLVRYGRFVGHRRRVGDRGLAAGRRTVATTTTTATTAVAGRDGITAAGVDTARTAVDRYPHLLLGTAATAGLGRAAAGLRRLRLAAGVRHATAGRITRGALAGAGVVARTEAGVARLAQAHPARRVAGARIGGGMARRGRLEPAEDLVHVAVEPELGDVLPDLAGVLLGA